MLKISITFNLSIGILGVCAQRDIYAHRSTYKHRHCNIIHNRKKQRSLKDHQ